MNSKDKICPVCEDYTFKFPDDYDICPICGWENDGLQREQKDYCGGANDLSVNESKIVYSLLQKEVIKINNFVMQLNSIKTKKNY